MFANMTFEKSICIVKINRLIRLIECIYSEFNDNCFILNMSQYVTYFC